MRVEDMPAGPELSALVSEHIMGECRHDWQKCGPNQWNYRCAKCGQTGGDLLHWGPDTLPKVGDGTPYSEEWGAIGLVVEKMAEQRYDLALTVWAPNGVVDAQYVLRGDTKEANER